MQLDFGRFQFFEKNKYHILVFLIALFLVLTFTHPQILVSDEWITVNQLAQIHSGHQVLVNEGKYGVWENGTPSKYFIIRNNFLGYTIFLPLISMPAYRIVDWLGSQFVYGILILWTLIPFCIGMLLKYHMNDPKTIRNLRLSSVLFIMSFLLFFINLFYYIPFPITGINPYAEFLAIVFTNCLYYAILAVLIYCILLEIFSDVTYSLFGTFVCLSGSSYLVWSTNMKDHMLVALLYGALLLSVVYYFRRGDRWFFPVSCIVIGLLAWARPELALPTFIGTVAFYWCTYGSIISRPKSLKEFIFIICSPLFVLVGAIPFFINNYFITKNPFLPTWAVWPIQNSISSATDITATGSLASGSINPVGKITQLYMADYAIHPTTFFNDFYGILFNPQNGSMGVFALTPLFLLALFLIPIIIIIKKDPAFSNEEKFLLGSMGLFSFLVFAAYIYQINGLNTSPACAPDIRYLSPVYLSMNIFGLIILKKIPEISKNSGILLKLLLPLCIIIPLVLVFNAHYYPDPDSSWSAIYYPLDIIASLMIYLLISLFLFLQVSTFFFNKQNPYLKLIIIFGIISIPFIWQVVTSFNIWDWGRGLGGYTFWIPIVRKFCQLSL
jgi:hypothetical protein